MNDLARAQDACRGRWTLVAWCSALLVGSGCASSSAERPVHPFLAQPLETEAWVEELYEGLVACTGVSRPFDEIEWFVVPAGAMGDPAGEGAVVGLFSPNHRIYIDARRVSDPAVVGHEILHYITMDGHDPAGWWRHSRYHACDPISPKVEPDRLLG